MKEKIKNFKLSKSPIMLMIIFSIITVVLSLGTSYAANVYLYDSKDVSYDNTKSGIIATDVQGAVDELYDAATDYSSMNTRVNGLEETIGDSTLTTTDQTLTGGINELNGKIATQVLYGANTTFTDSVETNVSFNGGYTLIQKQGNRIFFQALLNLSATKNAWTSIAKLKSNIIPSYTKYFIASDIQGTNQRVVYIEPNGNLVVGVSSMSSGLYYIETSYLIN